MDDGQAQARALPGALRREEGVEDAQQVAARDAGARFRLFLIPVRPSLRHRGNETEGNRLLFRGFDPAIPPSRGEDQYEDPPGLHWNDDGHAAAYARFVLELLEEG